MPTLADLQAAHPKCSFLRHTGHKTSSRCGLPMVYSVDGNVWKCPKDGSTLKGLLLAGWHAEGVVLGEAA